MIAVLLRETVAAAVEGSVVVVVVEEEEPCGEVVSKVGGEGGGIGNVCGEVDAYMDDDG
jgi:hypothetical protein